MEPSEPGFSFDRVPERKTESPSSSQLGFGFGRSSQEPTGFGFGRPSQAESAWLSSSQPSDMIFKFDSLPAKESESSSSTESNVGSSRFGILPYDYIPPAPKLPAKTTFTSFAHIIENNDFASFVKLLKKAKTDDVDSLTDELQLLRPFAIRTGDPTIAAARLLSEFQKKVMLENLFPELLSVISENLNDPTNIRNLSYVSKEIRGRMNSKVARTAATAPLTNVVLSRDLRQGESEYSRRKVEIELIRRFWEFFNKDIKYKRKSTFTAMYHHLQSTDKILDFANGTRYEDLYSTRVSFRAIDLTQLPDLFEAGFDHMPLDTLAQKLTEAHKYLRPGFGPDFSLKGLDLIESLPPIMKELAINRLRAFVGYVSFLFSQAREWILGIRPQVRERFAREALPPLARIDSYGCAVYTEVHYFEKEALDPDYEINPAMEAAYKTSASRLETEYLDLLQKARLFASDAIFGLPYNGQKFSSWLRPLALEWIAHNTNIAKRFALAMQEKLRFKKFVDLVANGIGVFMLLRRLGWFTMDNLNWPETKDKLVRIIDESNNNSWNRTILSQILYRLCLNTDESIPFHWKQELLAARMRNPKFYDTAKQELELEELLMPNKQMPQKK